MYIIPNQHIISEDAFLEEKMDTIFDIQKKILNTSHVQKELTDTLVVGDTLFINKYKDLLTPKPIAPAKRFARTRHHHDHSIEEEIQHIHENVQKPLTPHLSKKYLHDINLFLRYHESSLILDEYIDLLFDKTLLYLSLDQYTNAYHQLQTIEPYIPLLKEDKRVHYYDFMGNILLEAGYDLLDMKLLYRALATFDKLLASSQKEPLLPEVYQKTQFKKAKILMYLSKNKEAIATFEEVINMDNSLFQYDNIAQETNSTLKEKSRMFLRTLLQQKK